MGATGRLGVSRQLNLASDGVEPRVKEKGNHSIGIGLSFFFLFFLHLFIICFISYLGIELSNRIVMQQNVVACMVDWLRVPLRTISTC